MSLPFAPTAAAAFTFVDTRAPGDAALDYLNAPGIAAPYCLDALDAVAVDCLDDANCFGSGISTTHLDNGGGMTAVKFLSEGSFLLAGSLFCLSAGSWPPVPS